MIKNYSDFLLENILNESVLVFSDKFKKVLKNIESPISKTLLDLESKDFEIANNYIDITPEKDQISFLSDRRAQALFKLENTKATYIGNGGFLKHTEANSKIFKLLDYTPTERVMYHPEVGTKGNVLSKAVGPTSGKTYVKVEFPNGISVINENSLRYDDPIELAFSQGRQNVKVGKGVKGIIDAAKINFTPAEYERFVNLYKAEIEKLNDVFRHFELVDGDLISYWYSCNNYQLGREQGTLSNSCMSYVPKSFFEIYVTNPDVCQLLILKTEDGKKIKGRALVWKLDSPIKVTYMDRIYTHHDSDVELFRQYAKNLGWYYKPINNNDNDQNMISPDGPVNLGELVVKVNKGSYDYYPYLDTLKYLNVDKGTLSTLDDSDCITLEDTNGRWSEYEGDECDYCEGEGRIDCPECEGCGEYECPDCEGRGDIECDECDGAGVLTCMDCDGGEIECSTCDGSGKNDDDGEECSDCEGKGKVNCNRCEGTGEVRCSNCKNKGRIPCERCGSSGNIECDWCYGNGRVDCPHC